MKKFAIIAAALAIPAVMATESTASAAPMAEHRVRAIGGELYKNGKWLYTESYSVHKIALENLRLGHEGWLKSAQIRHQAHTVMLDALILMGDDQAHRAQRLCHQAHLELTRAHQFEHAARVNGWWAAHYEALARADAAEVSRLQALANAEPDPAAKARINDAANDLQAAANRNRTDAARHAAAERSERETAARFRADAERKAGEANRIKANSCSL